MRRIVVLLACTVVFTARTDAVSGPLQFAAGQEPKGWSLRILFESDRENPPGNSRYLAMNLDGTGIRRIEGKDWEPCDGKKPGAKGPTLVSSDRDTADGSDEIYLKFEGVMKRLTTNATDDKSPSPSPDGKLVTFRARDIVTGAVTFRSVSVATGKEVDLGSCKIGFESWAPTGHTLVFIDDSYEVVLLDASSGKRTVPCELGKDCPVGLQWMPDGKHLLIRTVDRRGGPWGLWKVGMDGTGLQCIYRGKAGTSPYSFSVSPDGKQLVFSAEGRKGQDEPGQKGNQEIFIMGIDGKGLKNLTNHEKHDRSPRFAWVRDE